jgi:imidazolonepropionase-like amidohydrolase
MAAGESTRNQAMRMIILRLLVACILAGMSSTRAAIDAEGRTGGMLSDENRIVLSNIRVFDVTRSVFEDARDILIEGTQIKAVGKVDAFDKDIGKIDLSGKFALPGLFDCHTHLAFLTTKREKEMVQDLRSFVANGITQVRDVGGPIDILSRMNQRISGGELLGPKLFFSGPMLERAPLFYESKNKLLPGFTVSISTKEDVDRVLLELAENGACIVKTYNKMDLDVYKHLLAVAKKHGLRVVHDPGRYLFHEIPMDVAIDLGVTSIEHGVAPWPVVLKNELKKQHDRLMAEDADQAARDSFLDKVLKLGVESISMDKLQQLMEKMLENDIYICPTLMMYGYDDIFTREFIRHKVKLLVGSDGPDPTGLFSEMKMLKDHGLSESEIIKGATIYPAQWLGVEDRFGSISPGIRANLVILDKDPLESIDNFGSTYMVLMNGRVVFHKSGADQRNAQH